MFFTTDISNISRGFSVGKGGNGMKGALVTAEMLAPITTTLNENLGVLLPVGIAIMGVMIGVSLIPRIVYKFL